MLDLAIAANRNRKIDEQITFLIFRTDLTNNYYKSGKDRYPALDFAYAPRTQLDIALFPQTKSDYRILRT